MFIKVIKITNPKNVVLQLPRDIASKWNISEKDSILMSLDEQTGNVVLSPQRGFYGNK